MSKESFFIGLISGTSIDGIDVALVKFANNKCHLVEHYLHPIDNTIRQPLNSLCHIQNLAQTKISWQNRIELMGKLDHQLGHLFAESVLTLLKSSSIDKSSIKAIGSHGQTIRHQPKLEKPFTFQIGDPNIIAYKTGITTVADFRRMDMAAGGQGAPLAPAFHHAMMRSEKENRLILNLGGIANITLLEKNSSAPVIGFDTGPANTLLDAHFQLHHKDTKNNFDYNGEFAQQGNTNSLLLESMLSDPYFNLSPPKSTGREYFCLNWLNEHINKTKVSLSPSSVQATLLELTTTTIVNTIKRLKLNDFKIYACGGGMHNTFLIKQLGEKINQPIYQTNVLDIDGDYLEAMTFAWLAKQRLDDSKVDLTSITGAKSPQRLGAIYQA